MNIAKLIARLSLGTTALCLTLFSALGASAGLSPDGRYNLPVPQPHPVYHYLERLETRGFIDFKASSRPLTRGEIAQYLLEVKSKNEKNPAEFSLSRREKAELNRYTAEFLVEADLKERAWRSNMSGFRKAVWPQAPLYRDGIDFLDLSFGEYGVEINPLLYWDIQTDSTGDIITRRTNGLNLTGSLPGGLGVYFDFRDNMETGRGPYLEDQRWKLYSDHAGFVTMKGENFAYYDLTRALLSFKTGGLLLNLGRGDIGWGSGRFGNLMLSNNPPPFDFVSARLDIADRIRFVYLTGVLHPYPEHYPSVETTPSGRERKLIERKMLAAHRLEIYPFEGLEIGLAEAVIYGERGLELAYLNPVNLYYSAEHDLGDMDNVSWSADFELNLIPGASLYGELFIDDMKTGELGTDFIGNKFACLAGIFLADPAGLKDIDLTLEYARLDPFVYTHIFPINTYKNWNSSLGHFLPPNSEGIFTALRWKPLYSFETGLNYSYVRHGMDTADRIVGGDIDTPAPVGGSRYVPFLSGERMNVSTYELWARWEPLEYYSITGACRLRDWSGGYQNEWKVIFGVNLY